MNNVEKIVEKIKAIRKEKGIRQGDMAKALGVTTGQYSHYETLKTEVTLKIFLKILDFFEMSVADFFLFETKTPPKENINQIIKMLEELRDEGL